MSTIAPQPHAESLSSRFVARSLADSDVPWIPLSAGKSFKPLRFLSGNRGFVELLRLEPGEEIPIHRHTGEVHAFNLEGSRQLCTGELIEPGGYVYEPPGNTDSWKVVGDVPLIVMIVATGAVEYLGPNNAVTARFTANTLLDCYREYCAANNTTPIDLVD